MVSLEGWGLVLPWILRIFLWYCRVFTFDKAQGPLSSPEPTDTRELEIWARHGRGYLDSLRVAISMRGVHRPALAASPHNYHMPPFINTFSQKLLLSTYMLATNLHHRHQPVSQWHYCMWKRWEAQRYAGPETENYHMPAQPAVLRVITMITSTHSNPSKPFRLWRSWTPWSISKATKRHIWPCCLPWSWLLLQQLQSMHQGVVRTVTR